MQQWTRTVSWGEADSVGTDTAATCPGTSAAGPVILVGHLNKWVFYFLVFEINFFFLFSVLLLVRWQGVSALCCPFFLPSPLEKGSSVPGCGCFCQSSPVGLLHAGRRWVVLLWPWGILSGEPEASMQDVWTCW